MSRPFIKKMYVGLTIAGRVGGTRCPAFGERKVSTHTRQGWIIWLGVSCHWSCPPFYSQVRCDTCMGALRGRLTELRPC